MKIRNGFVSNSSSSSFVLKVSSKIPTVFSVAEIMIKHRDKDNAQYGYDNKNKDVKKLRSLKIDPDTNIRFNSCNYDTYITKENDVYLITTCNNHGFWEIFEGLSADSTIYTIKYDEDLYNIQTDRDYYILELGVIGRQLSYQEERKYECKTKDCYCGDLFKVGDDIICSQCGKKIEKRKI